ncbi:MAG TPA: C4-type zinc ribbon domain-containing protein [Terriglobales bacterium]
MQSVELERARLAKALRELPAQVAEADAALTKAQTEAAAISDALGREEDFRNKLEREIAQHKQKAEKFRKQLDVVTTPAQAEAVEHEIAFSESEIERMENEEFVSLERTDAQEVALARARQMVETAAGALDKTRERIAVRQKEYTAEQAHLNAERDAVRAQIDPDWLVRFDRLTANKGTAVSRAENQQCTACRMNIRPQIWNQVREGELLTCDSCARILYWNPQMQAKEPEPEVPRNTDLPAIPKLRRVL